MQFRATGVVLACVVSAMACARPVPVPAPERAAALINPAWPYMGKARVAEGDSAMVVSGNRLASEVGRDILRQGGNAVDAAVAVGMALAVVHPEAGNIGGGGFMIFHMKDGRHYALDYREAAPGAASRDMYLDKDGNPTDASLVGHLAVGVPGAVAGMAEAHRRFGRLPWSQVVEPAVRLARDGFTVDDYRHRSLAGSSRLLGRFASSRRYFLPGGKAPAVGTRFVQADLARTLAAIRDSGPAGFYRGWVADSLAGEMRRGGGIITLKDLAGYHALWRDPIQIRYRGYTIYSMPPASSGGVTMAEILNIMEGYDPLPPFGSARLVHLETEAMRRAFTDRNVFLGDPDFVQMPLDRLLSKEYADSLRGTILPDRASPTRAFDPSIRTGSSTTHYSVVDAEGNAVSCTTTLNNSYGSGVAVRGAGFLLNDEMDDFATAPGRPNFYGLVQGEANAVAPGKRMLSAMTPSIVLDRNGRLLMVVGTPGGPTIITQVYHVISNVLDHGMSLPDAVSAPRQHHQALPDSIRLERNGFVPVTIQALQAMGHPVSYRSRWGDVEAIIRTPRGWQGVSDPRLGGGGAGY